ncbi:MAG: type III-B CRISPR-associated protein Cas10/Cmr2 [Myxococcota bacterium]
MSGGPHLVGWTCGPVQEFIATARRTLDLWFGSWVLSEVARAAAEAAVDRGATLVLPHALPSPEVGLPNQLVLRTDGDPQVLGQVMSDAARRRLSDIARRVFDRIEGWRIALDRIEAEAQVADLLEITWASVPLDDARFQADRQRLAKLVAGVKAHRRFDAPTWGSHRPKSSLDGAREAVVRLDARSANRLRARDNESLDAIALLKRLGPDVVTARRLPSVSSYALRPFLDRVSAPADAAVAAYRRALAEAEVDHHPSPVSLPVIGDLDPHLVYPGRLHEHISDPATLAPHLRALLRALGGGEPSPYYAVLLADGDRMGACLDACDTQARVTDVSRALTAFTAAVPGWADDHDAGVVYAGGDDVLALVPVDRALCAASALRDRYTERVARPVDGLSLRDGTGPVTTTLSVGVAIGHHLEPLSDVLARAREAEGAAKGAGRDAWAIRVGVRSGAVLATEARWRPREQPFGALGVLVRLLQEGAAENGEATMSRGLAYDLRTAAARLPPDSKEIARSEGRRVFAQKELVPAWEQVECEVKGPSDLVRLADQLGIARWLTGEAR